MWPQRLCLVALSLNLLALAAPVNGSDVRGSGESLTCGPGIIAALGLTEPARPDEPIMWPRSDLGIGRGAWCRLEARDRVREAGAGAAVFATLLLGIRRSRRTRSQG